MDAGWMEHKKNTFLNNQKGQSAVEYILLIAVIAALINTVFTSDAFKRIFGDEGTFAKVYKQELEYSYRHALRGKKEFVIPDYKEPHDSYFDGSATRFFSAKEPYPQ
jgi:Flp pilus assembly pilin Flp